VVSVNGSDYQEDTCVSYWPLQDGQTLHTRSGFSVTLRQTIQVDHITVRKLELTNDTAQLHQVTQLQFQSWKMYDQVSYIVLFSSDFSITMIRYDTIRYDTI